ncbi:MAG TPA: MBL fold metallo-hydrolase RNA specificity domain-containing protein [archaeon]|nr:MBL fold metallo-hydrolase RNA specificity domain-containing protein [archaeon]
MQVFDDKGLVFRAKEELFVDAHGIKNKEALITHAHSDHAKPTKSNSYYMTQETASLIDAEKRNLNVKKIPFKKKFSLGEFECSFHSSGHILGSAQVEINNSANAVLTSDFKLQKSILFDGAEILPSEILVIETTFGTSEYKFPARDVVYEDMMKWMNFQSRKNHFIVLGGYSTGKAQELTKIVNEFMNETPLVYKKIFDQNKIYENEGVKLGNYLELNHNLKDSNILIMPPHLINDDLLSVLQLQLGKKVECAIATGWRASKYKTFPLSDHADYYDLLEYVKNSNPKLVLTTHGFEEEFAKSVQRKLKINARPLSKAGQKTIAEFSSVLS